MRLDSKNKPPRSRFHFTVRRDSSSKQQAASSKQQAASSKQQPPRALILWQRIVIPMGTTGAPFWTNLSRFSYELTYLRSLVRSWNAKQSGSRVHALIRRMHDASRYIDDLLTMNSPEFEEVMYRT